MEGDRVAWTSRQTGRDHTGVVVIDDNGIGKALVRPDGWSLRWTDWVEHADLSAISDGSSAS